MKYFQFCRAFACLVFAASEALSDMGRDCQPRALTPTEKDAADNVAERLRKALPAAPAGWSMRDERTDAAAGWCPAENGAKPVPQPVTVSVLRSFVRKDAPPAAAAEPPVQAPAASVVTPEQEARAKALETELGELQRKERDAGEAYREARRAGDSAAQKEASEASRKLRGEMAPLHRELAQLRRQVREARAAAGAATTGTAQKRMEEARANRRDASVVVHTNLRQAEMRGARPVPVSNVPLAFRDGGGATHLLFGDWRRSGAFAMSQIDESAPSTRVQNLRVRIDANEPAGALLIEALDVKALAQMAQGPSARPAPNVRAPAPAQPESFPAEIALKVGTKDYRFSGPAECKAAQQASIYGIPAALYSVSQRSAGESLRLTLWQPKDGSSPMMSLHVSSGTNRYEVDTVKGGTKRDTKGSGTATVRKAGSGGAFTIDARAASGEPIGGKISCSRFGGIQAEGG